MEVISMRGAVVLILAVIAALFLFGLGSSKGLTGKKGL
jgi:hypothetical protein